MLNSSCFCKNIINELKSIWNYSVHIHSKLSGIKKIALYKKNCKKKFAPRVFIDNLIIKEKKMSLHKKKL